MRDLNPPSDDTRFERWTVVAGILLLGFNLRTAAVSVGPVLAEVAQGLGMEEVATGLLTALPAFTQSVGYGLSAAGPFGIGLLYHATGGWTWPLLVLTATAGATAVLAIAVGRPQFIEDQIR